MAKGTQGGSSEQHAKAGSQSHKNDDKKSGSAQKSGGSSGKQGGSSEQHAKAGSQSHKNDR